MSSNAAVICPTILWAQRPELVFVTVPLPNSTDVSIQILENGKILSIDATAGTPPQKYHVAVELFRDVSPEESRHTTGLRQIELTLKKKGPGANDDEDEVALCRAWPRLTKGKAKNALIQVDWSRWKDDDEGASGDDEGELGMDLGDMMTHMMMQQAHDETEEAIGGPVPKFGEAAGQGVMSNEAIMNVKDTDDCAEDDFDDLPPLEE